MTLAAATTDYPSTDGTTPSPEDQSPDQATGVDQQGTDSSDTAADGADSDSTASDDTELLTAAEQEAVARLDPESRVKAFQKAFTKKTQKLSTERKALSAYKGIIDGLQTDAPGTIRALAAHFGVPIAPGSQPADTTAADAADPTLSIGDEIAQAMRESLGPEYEDLADRLAPAILTAAEKVVARRTKPLEDHQAEIVKESAVRETQAVLDAFGKKHPDWQQHEARMTELSARILPGAGVTEAEYLETLYSLATRDKDVGASTKKVIARMQKSAEAASKDAGGITTDKVAERSSGPLSFDEAARLARQGIRVE